MYAAGVSTATPAASFQHSRHSAARDGRFRSVEPAMITPVATPQNSAGQLSAPAAAKPDSSRMPKTTNNTPAKAVSDGRSPRKTSAPTNDSSGPVPRATGYTSE